MNRTGRCLQICADTVSRIQCHRLCHAILHSREQYLGLYDLIRTHAGCQQSRICTDIHQNMLVAGFCGLCALCKILVDYNTGTAVTVADARDRQLTGLGTDGCLYNTGRLGEIFIFQALMNPAHDLGPELLMEACLTGLTAQLMFVTIIIISYPDTRRIVRGHTYEPYVTVLGCGTGFTGRGHITDLRRTGCSACSGDYIFHAVDEKPCILLGNYLGRFGRGIIQNYISIIVYDFTVHLRTVIGSAIGNSRIGCGQLQVGDTVGQSAQCQRLAVVRVGAIQLQAGKSKP